MIPASASICPCSQQCSIPRTGWLLSIMIRFGRVRDAAKQCAQQILLMKASPSIASMFTQATEASYYSAKRPSLRSTYKLQRRRPLHVQAHVLAGLTLSVTCLRRQADAKLRKVVRKFRASSEQQISPGGAVMEAPPLSLARPGNLICCTPIREFVT